jgi:hypothetical protein
MTREHRKLSAYSVRRALVDLKKRVNKPVLMERIEKIANLYESGNEQATVAQIHEKLYSMNTMQSANKNLSTLIKEFNEYAQDAGVSIRCCITQEKKGGAANRLVWFEGTESNHADPMFDDYDSVSVLLDNMAIDIIERFIVIMAYWNPNERDANLKVFGHTGAKSQAQSGLSYWELGRHGNYRVVMVHTSEQGYIEGYRTPKKAHEIFRPYAIMSVGIGWGAKEGEQKSEHGV